MPSFGVLILFQFVPVQFAPKRHLSDVQTTLNKPQFRDMFTSTAGPSIFSNSAVSRAVVHGDRITGGTYGMTVQGGASLTVPGVTVARVRARSRVEGGDVTSSLIVSDYKTLHLKTSSLWACMCATGAVPSFPASPFVDRALGR